MDRKGVVYKKFVEELGCKPLSDGQRNNLLSKMNKLERELALVRDEIDSYGYVEDSMHWFEKGWNAALYGGK